MRFGGIILRLKKYPRRVTMTKIKKVISHNAVLCVAVCAAIITMFFVPPDKEYIGYFDFKTLTCLFCVLAVVNALGDIRVFTVMAKKIIRFLCLRQVQV